MKNLIFRSWLESLKLMNKHKKAVLVIFLVQLVFFMLISMDTVLTLTPAFEATQEVLSYIQQLRMDEEALARSLITGEDMFGENPALIYENYDIIFGFLRLFIILAVSIFIVFEGLNWALTVYLHKKKRLAHILRYMLNFLIITIVYLAILFLFLIMPLKTAVNSATFPKVQVAFALFGFMVLNYFTFIAYSLIHENDMALIAKRTFLIGITKAYLIVPVAIIDLALVGMASFFMLKSAEANIFLVLWSVTNFVFTFVFVKIWFVRLVHMVDASLFR